MANGPVDLEIHVDSQTSAPEIQKPLLSNHTTPTPQFEEIDTWLVHLGSLLLLLGIDQSTWLRTSFGWILFILLGVAVPTVALWITACDHCQNIEVTKFQVTVQISETCLAFVSLLCMGHNLRKYGLRRFLFVEVHHPFVRFRDDVETQIRGSCSLLKWIVFPCFVVKSIREVWRIIYIHDGPWWENAIIVMAIFIPWLYLTTVYLSACVLFNLVCNLQIVHVEDYAKLLEGTSDVSLFLKEHMCLRYQLYKISHRFRMYLLLAFLVITASQTITLFEITYYSGTITFLNAGDFLVSSAVQLVGGVLCLRAAAKTTHRAQRIASIASKWHALATCNSCEASELKDGDNGNSPEQDADPIYTLLVADYESDLDPSENFALPVESHFASSVASYQKRQALVMYFQFNQAGITIFGLAVDRALMNTLFFIELSLILWVLGNTMVGNS